MSADKKSVNSAVLEIKGCPWWVKTSDVHDFLGKYARVGTVSIIPKVSNKDSSKTVYCNIKSKYELIKIARKVEKSPDLGEGVEVEILDSFPSFAKNKSPVAEALDGQRAPFLFEDDRVQIPLHPQDFLENIVPFYFSGSLEKEKKSFLELNADQGEPESSNNKSEILRPPSTPLEILPPPSITPPLPPPVLPPPIDSRISGPPPIMAARPNMPPAFDQRLPPPISAAQRPTIEPRIDIRPQIQPNNTIEIRPRNIPIIQTINRPGPDNKNEQLDKPDNKPLIRIPIARDVPQQPQKPPILIRDLPASQQITPQIRDMPQQMPPPLPPPPPPPPSGMPEYRPHQPMPPYDLRDPYMSRPHPPPPPPPYGRDPYMRGPPPPYDPRDPYMRGPPPPPMPPRDMRDMPPRNWPPQDRRRY
ncbi:hypothetical protein TVAG_407180 [Trichomonas vaginalis G3]|uniref:RRM domain-containing protein n=1 Tax=Trichomonas vaginalis (strain ATCC PRA-98 / G3) TaxID=412133 RepID=A2F415_TRIV3|nr:hypothetical protein TVAGG3_0227300 [Trichomonas vaginalis G3]EAY00369.1 hypothetical protein TVAG_407180 [Trichomonas vaginalis G3]KAI5552354.1 hypothetical protein TVAGG3_0227300 [Trichomonas vaginalis G3]|eukprot:XP_001313298.1 hypothetical protein [Trichomonas vaginalis G3]